MFFPYGTDAPIYYWPFTTVAMIAVNVLLFVLQCAFPEIKEMLIMQTGHYLNPIQWLTTNFVHENFMHLAGNILFLWSFGLIVEGKLGWRKTLWGYLGTGVVYGAIVQVLTLFGTTHYVLGASAVVYAFMAMSVIWAPENSLQCVFYFGFYVKLCEVPIKIFVAIFLALQVVELLLTGGALSSAFLHAVGAALGFGLGIWLVKTRRVDCENWDIFSIAANRHRMTRRQRDEEVLNSAEYKQHQQALANKREADALEWIHEQVREGNAKSAAEVYHRTKAELPDWQLSDADLHGLIVVLRKSGLNGDVIPLMAEYLKRNTAHAVAVRIALGETLLRENRSAQALKVLAKLSDAALDDRQRQIVLGLRRMAQKRHEADPYEVADEDW